MKRLTTMLALGVLLGGAAPSDGGTIEMIVLGVVSPGATFGLKKHLMGLQGVTDMHFDLMHGLATMRLAPGAVVSDTQLRDAVRGAAYTPGDIHRIPPGL